MKLRYIPAGSLADLIIPRVEFVVWFEDFYVIYLLNQIVNELIIIFCIKCFLLCHINKKYSYLIDLFRLKIEHILILYIKTWLEFPSCKRRRFKPRIFKRLNVRSDLSWNIYANSRINPIKQIYPQTSWWCTTSV